MRELCFFIAEISNKKTLGIGPDYRVIYRLLITDSDVIDVSYEWTLVSGGSTIMESVVEDGVGMFTTYSDEEGELVVKHYCALGTEPVLSVSEATDRVVALSFDGSRSPLMGDSHDFVNSMKWTMDANDSNSMVYEYTVYLDGELTSNRAELKKQ